MMAFKSILFASTIVFLTLFQNCARFNSDRGQTLQSQPGLDQYPNGNSVADNEALAKPTPEILVYGYSDPAILATSHVRGIRGHLGAETDPALQMALAPYSKAIEVLPNRLTPMTPTEGDFPNMLATAKAVADGASKIQEISIDDFVNWYADQNFEANNRLTQLLDVAKARRIDFGVTIYDSEAGSDPRWPFRASSIPETLRNRIDIVHFYPLFRSNISQYQNNYSLTEKLFPKAKIIVGLYAYDRRRDEVSLGDSSHANFTLEEEMASYEQYLQTTCRAVQDQRALAVEIFPGHWGMESSLLSSGIAVTEGDVETAIKMRKLAVSTLSKCYL